MAGITNIQLLCGESHEKNMIGLLSLHHKEDYLVSLSLHDPRQIVLNQNICLVTSLSFTHRSSVCFCNNGIISSFCDSKDV